VVFRDGTALVSERDSARILELGQDGSSRAIGTVVGVAGSGEGGLLGLAVDEQGRLYVYSTGAGENRIQRFDVTGTPGSLALGDAETILDGIPSASYHDGGRLAFGPDGMLYATVGDAGQAGQAQDVDSLVGKILRMAPDGSVPNGNPFEGSLVYSYGHRNPQGLTWAQDGTMFATEFGQNTWDELNIITAGANYGWPTVEGIEEAEGFTNPVQQWTPDVASPSGMTHIDGTLFIANLRGSVLRAVPVADPATFTDHYDGEYGRIRDVTVSPDGELWFLTNNTDGRGTPGPDDDRILGVDLEQR
jgi:glucose/arabinose dehydrogenase